MESAALLQTQVTNKLSQRMILVGPFLPTRGFKGALTE